ncbi:MAG: GNAT family N-acetyltransferase [Oscillospiraceae bacterium]|nr:GNAT family N-acetyltransferase [Oscillospiraceae bacterium]
MNDYLPQLKRLLALDFNCSPDDFDKAESVITESALNEGRRVYSTEPPFFGMATMGSNAVITADERLHPFLRDYIRAEQGHRLFELPKLFELEAELNKYSYTVNHSHHLFLYDKSRDTRGFKKEYPVKWFYGKAEIEGFYGDSRFPNAICTEYDPSRPDTIVVCAYDGDKIMGMAGCSEDAPHWQQIGIDVLPEYRSMGVGSYLVRILRDEIIRRGDIPFYGTGLANYHSWNIALNCGFRPVWVEMNAIKKQER